MYLYPLHKRLEPNEVGGKSAGLSKLISFGVLVPKGFAISKELLKTYQKTKGFPMKFTTELETKLLELNSKRIIVRSSAIGEDSKSHSFAGQLDSFIVDKELASVKEAPAR